MVSLSIVIPVLGGQEEVDLTLLSVLENRPDDCEVILVHPPSYVDPYDLADEVTMVVSEAKTLPALLNDAIGVCSGDVVHFLSSGVSVDEGWCQAALELFEDDNNLAAVAPVLPWKRTRCCGIDYDVRRGKRLVRRSTNRTLGPLLGIGFYQASALRFMHGFDSQYGELADVELGIRLKSAGYRAAVATNCSVLPSKKPAVEITQGYAGGSLRARLFRSALTHRLARSSQRWSGLLSEPMTHGLSPKAIPAMLGHVATWFSRTPAPVITSMVDGQAQKNDKRVA